MKTLEAVGGVIPNPKTALTLATIAYDDKGAIPLQVFGQTEGMYEVV